MKGGLNLYCSNCGKEIDDKAVVCIHCGCETKNLNKKEDTPVIINNSASAASSSTAPTPTIIKKKYSLLLDIILIFCTCGLWLIWMAIRPKYEKL